MIYQKQLGVLLRGFSWSVEHGPYPEIELSAEFDMPFYPEQFLHMLVLGRSGAGKGIFCSTLGCWLHENYDYKFIDFNDGNDFENGCYGWPQEDETMLARIEDTFYLNTPHGYDFEMLFPQGFLTEYPAFFEPFTLSYRDLTAQDFRFFYPKDSQLDASEMVDLAQESEDIEAFLKKVKKDYTLAFEPLLVLAERGTLCEETSLDFKALANKDIIHSVATNFMNKIVGDQRSQPFLLSVLVRMIHDSREGALKKTPVAFYVREVGMVEDTITRMIATRGRHMNVHFIADSQRRVSMMDKTASLQFGSYAIFKIRGEMFSEIMQGFNIAPETVASMCNANTGVGLINFDGGRGYMWPCAISPPVCGYKSPRDDFMQVCRERGTPFVNAT